MAKKFELDDKVEIHNLDIGSKDGLKLITESDLIIMHNPFEWFTKDGGQVIFDRLTKNFKEGFFNDFVAVSLEQWVIKKQSQKV